MFGCRESKTLGGGVGCVLLLLQLLGNWDWGVGGVGGENPNLVVKDCALREYPQGISTVSPGHHVILYTLLWEK